MDIDNSFSWREINSSTPAVVLRLEHYGSLGIVRSLGKLGVKIYGVDKKAISSASVSRFCYKNFNWDLDQVEENKSLDFLLKLSMKIGKPSVLIPTTDETSLLISKYSYELRKYFLFPEISFGLVQRLCSKKEMYFLAKKCGVPVPESFFPNSIDDILNYCDNASYPVLIKGIDGGKLEKKTGKKMMLVYNKSQLINICRKTNILEENNLMIQEYIPDTKDHMWIFNGYVDSTSTCLAAFTGRKLRQNPIYTGMTSLGICQWNDELISMSNKFLNEIGYQGAVDIDFVYDIRDDKYKILDVNPRVGATFRLFVGANGIDTVRAMYLDITKQPVFLSKPIEGRKWIVEDKDLLSSYFYNKEGKLNLIEWIRSFKGIKEAGYFAIDDPAPSLWVWGDHIKRSSAKTIKKIKSNFSSKKGVRNSNINQENPSSSNISGETDQVLRVKKYYDQNDYWHGAIYSTSSEPHALGVRRRKKYIMKMLDKINNFNHDQAIDIGCGPGAYLQELLNRGCKVYGIDLSTEMLKICKNNFTSGRYNANLLCADASQLPLSSERFNTVFCVGLLQYVTSVEKTIEEINRIACKDGLVVICVENMFAISNLGYVALNKFRNFLHKGTKADNIKTNTYQGILSNWFLSKVSVPHLYRLYNPKSLENIFRQKGFKKISTMTYGYPFKILRRLKIIPVNLINSLENKIESAFNKIRVPYLSNTGEFYIGIFKKVSNDFSYEEIT